MMARFGRLYHRRGWRAVGLATGIALAGAAIAFAWQSGLWGLFTGASLGAVWLAVLAWWNAARPSPRPIETGTDSDSEQATMQGLLLDAAPIPLLAIEGDTARALNRTARAVFGTDDRIVPPNPALVDPGARYLRHEGRQWRVDRVVAPAGPSVAALIDIDREERVAEARASAELIEILGHELFNGLAPIVSLAESASNAAARSPIDPALLEEITGSLARRAEGLQRFATAYRGLARLPEPLLSPVEIPQFAADCARAFAERWIDVAFELDCTADGICLMDRDQMHQAVWALLNNAAEAAVEVDDPIVRLAIMLEANHLELTAFDNGFGVAPDIASHIFRPFHTTKARGSGIGLSLARQIARAHGGSLDLTGANPTAFRLSVPAASGI